MREERTRREILGMLGTTVAAGAVPLSRGLGITSPMPLLADFRRDLLGRREKVVALYAYLQCKASDTLDPTEKWLCEGESHLFYTPTEEVIVSRRGGFIFTEWLADGEYFRGVEFVDGSRDPEILYQGSPSRNAKPSLSLTQFLPVPADVSARIELRSKAFADQYVLDQGPEIFYLDRDHRVVQVDILRGETSLYRRTVYDDFEDLGDEIPFPRGVRVLRFDYRGKAEGNLWLRVDELTLDQGFPPLSTAFWETNRG